MKLKNILFLLLLNCFFPSMVNAQDKFQYLTVSNLFDSTANRSISYQMDTTGLNQNLKDQLAGIINNEAKFKTRNQLFNFLGNIGWELYEKVSQQDGMQASGYLNTNPGQPVVTKYYFTYWLEYNFKIKIH